MGRTIMIFTAPRQEARVANPPVSTIPRPAKQLLRMSKQLCRSQVRQVAENVLYHLHSAYLFTASDLKTIVGPKTAFGIVSVLSASAFDIQPTPSPSWVLCRVPLVAFWTWINLLPFVIDNQRQPASIREDSLNKPWRPLPTKRLTQAQARYLILTLYPIALVASVLLGGVKQCLALMALGFWYNDCLGADSSFVVRNLINACGFICYASGAMEVALGRPLPENIVLNQWFSVVGAVVFSTVQIQDMYDQAGDALRGRRTMPLVVGDAPCRWMIAVPMVFWTCFCPWFWSLGAGAYGAPAILGGTVVVKTLVQRTVKDDAVTFWIYNCWLVSLYLLPMVKSYAAAQ